MSIVRHNLARMDIWRARSVAASVGGMSSALLLAEAEEATRCFLERHLTQDGFEVVEAENGEALDLLERARPDLPQPAAELGPLGIADQQEVGTRALQQVERVPTSC